MKSQHVPAASDPDIAEDWASAELRDGIVVDIQPGFACGKNNRAGEGIGHIRPMNVNVEGKIDLSDLKFVPASEVNRDERVLRAGDVVFNNTNSRELVGKTAFYNLPQRLAFSNHMTRIRCRDDALAPPYCALALHYLWQTGYFQSVCNNHVSQSSVGREVLLETAIPLPPLAEQKRIVEKVEQLLARVSAVRERLARVPTLIKRFRQAVLAAACCGRLTADWRKRNPETEPISTVLEKLGRGSSNIKTRRGVPDEVGTLDEFAAFELPDSWSVRSVASLLRTGGLADVKDGNHGSNHPKAKELGDEGLPFVTAAQVKNYRIDYEGAPKVCDEPLKRLKVGFAEPGDAVVTHKGTVGRAAVNTQPCVLTPQTTYYRCNAEALNSHYLVYFFSSRFFYSQLVAVMSQTTRDFVPISEQYLLFIFLPPLEEQREIARRVDSLFKLADAIEKRVVVATARAEKLTQAILAKAFRGELVPTEAELALREVRSYEPASALLARIRAECAGQSSHSHSKSAKSK